jgi:hypothetical protein
MILLGTNALKICLNSLCKSRRCLVTVKYSSSPMLGRCVWAQRSNYMFCQEEKPSIPTAFDIEHVGKVRIQVYSLLRRVTQNVPAPVNPKHI